MGGIDLVIKLHVITVLSYLPQYCVPSVNIVGTAWFDLGRRGLGRSKYNYTPFRPSDIA